MDLDTKISLTIALTLSLSHCDRSFEDFYLQPSQITSQNVYIHFPVDRNQDITAEIHFLRRNNHVWNLRPKHKVCFVTQGVRCIFK